MNKTKKELMAEIDELKKELAFKEAESLIKSESLITSEHKTKAELLEEIDELREQIRMMNKYEGFKKDAEEMACMVAAYEHAGFTRKEIMSILIAAAGVKR